MTEGDFINTLINLLIIVNLVLPMYFIKNQCIHKSRLEVNHILLFSIGFIYYLLIPIIIGINKLFCDKPAMDLWYSIFNQINDINLIKYLCILILFYISFLLGSVFEQRRKKDENNRKTVYFNKKVLDLYFYLFGIISVIFIYKFKNDFFKGYTSVTSLSFEKKGPFIALTLMIFCLSIIYSTKINLKNNLTFKKCILNKFFVLYMVVAILALSMGGRLYFVSGLTMLFVYKTVYFENIKIKNFMYFLFIIAFSMILIGGIRSGIETLDLKKEMFNLLQEPLYTSFSLISFVQDGILEFIKFPKFLVSELINIIPTFILPNKLEYVLDPVNFGYYIYSPLGARSVFTSLMVNFGILGSMIFLFIFGLFLEKMKKRKNSVISKTIYICTSGFVMFTFFRDGFVTSLIKNIFQFSILLPIFIVISANFISVAVKGRQ